MLQTQLAVVNQTACRAKRHYYQWRRESLDLRFNVFGSDTQSLGDGLELERVDNQNIDTFKQRRWQVTGWCGIESNPDTGLSRHLRNRYIRCHRNLSLQQQVAAAPAR